MATQFAANANAVVNSTGTPVRCRRRGYRGVQPQRLLGGSGLGLNTTDGHDILLTLENGIVVGRVSGGADDGKAAFAISIDSSGHISMVEWLSIQHPNTGNPDDLCVDRERRGPRRWSRRPTATAIPARHRPQSAACSASRTTARRSTSPRPPIPTSWSRPRITTPSALATDTASSSANFGGIFGLTSAGGSDGAANTPSLSYALDVTGYAGGPGGIYFWPRSDRQQHLSVRDRRQDRRFDLGNARRSWYGQHRVRRRRQRHRRGHADPVQPDRSSDRQRSERRPARRSWITSSAWPTAWSR